MKVPKTASRRERKDAPVRGGTRARRAPATYLDRDRQRERGLGLGLGLGLAILGRLALGRGGRLVAHRAMRSEPRSSDEAEVNGSSRKKRKKRKPTRAARHKKRASKKIPIGQSETGVLESPDARAGKRANARDTAGIQAPNHRPSHASPSTKWPLSSTPPSPRASPPPRCVSIRRGPLARASRARFRGGPRANIASRSSLPTSKPRVQNVSDPICRASPPSTARRRPPHLLRQGRRRPRPRAVRVTPDRPRARGLFPATVRDVICRGCVFRVGPRAGVPTAVVAEDPVRSPRRRSAPCGRVTPRPRHARGDARLSTHAPPSRAPTRTRTRGPVDRRS